MKSTKVPRVHDLTNDSIDQIGEELLSKYREVVIDLIIFDATTQSIYAQKRNLDRELFPGLWEFPGGMLQQGETLSESIVKNLTAETSMQLASVQQLVHVFQWDKDNDVATAQLLITANGTYKPDYTKVSDVMTIAEGNLDFLLLNGQTTPIHKGARYAFDFLGYNTHQSDEILFYDELVSTFLKFHGFRGVSPYIRIGGTSKFTIDHNSNTVLISESFIKISNDFANAHILLHQLFHNYFQNITSYDNIKAIRKHMGNSFSLYIDVVTDVATYTFLRSKYNFIIDSYLGLCFEKIQDYAATTLENTKVSRLLGTALSIYDNRGKLFFPVVDEQELYIYTLTISNGLQFIQTRIEQSTVDNLKAIYCDTNVSPEESIKSTYSLIRLIKGERI
jgi:hypothetical protein